MSDQPNRIPQTAFAELIPESSFSAFVLPHGQPKALASSRAPMAARLQLFPSLHARFDSGRSIPGSREMRYRFRSYRVRKPPLLSGLFLKRTSLPRHMKEIRKQRNQPSEDCSFCRFFAAAHSHREPVSAQTSTIRDQTKVPNRCKTASRPVSPRSPSLRKLGNGKGVSKAASGRARLFCRKRFAFSPHHSWWRARAMSSFRARRAGNSAARAMIPSSTPMAAA